MKDSQDHILPQSGLIRERVVERLKAAHIYPIAVVVAPAGFGKTTAIRHALAELSGSLFMKVPPQCTLQQFIHEFARCCSANFPAMAVPPDMLPSALDDANQALDIFLAWIHAHLKNTSCTIAIDDVQNAELSEGVISLIVRLVDVTKSHLKWILASRLRGALPLTRWQAYGDSDTPVSADDLRITLDEAIALSKQLGSPATREDLTRWIEQTNGFAVPLAYAIRTSARRGTADFVMDRTRSITFDYLAEQIWQDLQPDDRALLEVASFLPPVHIHDLEGSGVSDASSRATKLGNDIAFISVGTSGLFTMHDLFRDFIQQQLLLKSAIASRARRREAASVLSLSRNYEIALRNLLDAEDFEHVSFIIEKHNFRVIDQSLIRKIAEVAARTRPEDHGIKMLLLQAEFWSWRGDSRHSRILAEEILRRPDAGSDQILLTVQVVFRSLSLASIDERTTWIARIPEIFLRMNQADQNVAKASLAAFLAQKSETRERSRNLLASSNPGISALAPASRIDALLMVSVAYFHLGDTNSSLVAARAAVAATDTLGNLREQARALNNLGISLWNAYSPEVESLFETSRDAVERSGSWAFCQTSHWIPAIYFALSGNAKKSRMEASLQYDAPSVNDSDQKRLQSMQRHATNLNNILAENYREVILSDRRANITQNTDMAYELSTDAAIAYALESNFTASEDALKRSRDLRQGLSGFLATRILEYLFIEILCLGANGQWSQARRLQKQVARTNFSLEPLQKALDRFCDGPPFTGLDDFLELCYGKPYIGLIAIITKRVADRFKPDRSQIVLSSAEGAVLRLLSIGKSNKAIADARSRSPETIKRQIAAIYKKLGVDNRISAVAVARENNLL